MSQIFISYRRSDAQGKAQHLAERLSREFNKKNVFIDDQLESNWSQEIFEAVSKCRVFVAVIGPRWLDVADSRGNRRLNDPNDVLRKEVATALARGVAIVPVLVDGAQMPNKEHLPQDLHGLTAHQASFVRDQGAFEDDIRRLVHRIRTKLRADMPPSVLSKVLPAVVCLGLGAIAVPYASFYLDYFRPYQRFLGVLAVEGYSEKMELIAAREREIATKQSAIESARIKILEQEKRVQDDAAVIEQRLSIARAERDAALRGQSEARKRVAASSESLSELEKLVNLLLESNKSQTVNIEAARKMIIDVRK